MAAPTKRPPAVHLHRSQEVSSSLLSPSCYLLLPGNRDMMGKRSNFAHVITFRQLIERGKATPLQLVRKKVYLIFAMLRFASCFLMRRCKLLAKSV